MYLLVLYKDYSHKIYKSALQLKDKSDRKKRVAGGHCEEIQMRNSKISARNTLRLHEQKKQQSAHRTGHCIFQAQDLAFRCNSWRSDRTLLQFSESWTIIKFVTNSTKNEFSELPFLTLRLIAAWKWRHRAVTANVWLRGKTINCRISDLLNTTDQNIKTRRHIAEGYNLQTQRCGNLRSRVRKLSGFAGREGDKTGTRLVVEILWRSVPDVNRSYFSAVVKLCWCTVPTSSREGQPLERTKLKNKCCFWIRKLRSAG
jgi:hypothetical protein